MREEEQQFPEPPRVRRDPRARGALFFQANHHAGIGEERFQNRDGQLPVFAGQQVGRLVPVPANNYDDVILMAMFVWQRHNDNLVI